MVKKTLSTLWNNLQSLSLTAEEKRWLASQLLLPTQKRKALTIRIIIQCFFVSVVTNDSIELSVTDKIWVIILDVVLDIAERYSIDATELFADFAEGNSVAHMLCDMYIYKQAS